MEIYRKLMAAIDNHIGVALATICNMKNNKNRTIAHDNMHHIGSKLLVRSDGEVFSQTDLPNKIISHLVKVVAEILNQKRSQTYVLNLEGDQIELYVDVFPPPLHLIVAGAGHIAKPVVQIGSMLGFYTTVVCDRSHLATSEQFPWADEVICTQYIDYFRNVGDISQKNILLLTRGHQYDVLILRELLNQPAAYLGMIGSRRRISGVFSQLNKEFPKEVFHNVYAPIGLDIGAQTPEEIAISILGEILKVNNHKTGGSLREKVSYFIREEKEEGALD